MNVKIDIHLNGKFESKLKFVPKWKVPDSTKKEIFDFIEKARIGQINEGKKLSDRTLSKYLSLLRHSLELINKQTSKITKEDIEKFDKKISKENLKSSSDFKICLKIFLHYKLGEEKTRKLTSWLDVKTKNKTPDYLTEIEVEKLYKNCKSPSERYLISVLFDVGSRAEEFLNIRYEDIQLPDKNNNYVKITLKQEYSKTKGRVVSLYWKHSLESIRDYLKEREREEIKSNEQVYNKNYDALRKFLFRLGKKILNKKIYPHLFRHSSATYYAPKLNRQQLCYRYGWAFSSEMPDVYISRAGMENKELDEKFTSTELEDLQKKFEKEKFDKDMQIDNLKKNLIVQTLSSHKLADYLTGKINKSQLNEEMRKIQRFAEKQGITEV
jgi:integrase/recombinase XerD